MPLVCVVCVGVYMCVLIYLCIYIYIYIYIYTHMGFPLAQLVKKSACNAGDLGLIPGLGRSPGEGKGYPLQYSSLENSMDCTVHGVAKSQTQMSDFHFHFICIYIYTYSLCFCVSQLCLQVFGCMFPGGVVFVPECVCYLYECVSVCVCVSVCWGH